MLIKLNVLLDFLPGQNRSCSLGIEAAAMAVREGFRQLPVLQERVGDSHSCEVQLLQELHASGL